MDSYVIQYAPIVVLVVVFLLKNKIFVTPEQLEKTHTQILEEVENKFATKEILDTLKEDINELKNKVDKIYDILLSK